MERNIIAGILIATLVVLGIALLIPGSKTGNDIPKLPWQIALDATGNLTVFGLTIDQSTLGEAEQLYQEEATVSLFVSPEGNHAVEAFFERLYLNGIRANLVLNIDIDQATATAMFERGIRVSRLGSGTSKVTLSEEDLRQIKLHHVSLITYLPATDLDAELVSQRFGEPEKRLREESGVEHWLYPQKGLDIALNPEGKEVFQYVPPARFDQILDPLLQTASQPTN